MLSPPDADLVRRDAALPGLGTLLDTDALSNTLRAALPATDLGGARATYVRYKPGTSCLVAYQLDVAGESVDAYARAYRPTARDKLNKARQRPSVTGPLGPGRLVLEDDAIVVSTFPNDGRVKALPRLGDAEARRNLVRTLVPERPDLWERDARALAYKPDRRFVAALPAEDGAQAVLKLYTEAGYVAAGRKAGAFRSGGPLRVARQLGGSRRRCALSLEWLPGRLLSDAIAGPALRPGALIPVGEALAELHGQDPEGLECLPRSAEAAGLLAVAAAIGFVSPGLAARADDLARRLVARLADAPALARPLHGDFYAKQVLLDGDTVAVLDFDEAVRGDAATDLGLFVAHLERGATRGTVPADQVRPLRDALLEGYARSTGRPLPERVDLYAAAGLLRLAPHPFRNREPSWPERTEAILARAETILGRVSTTLRPLSPPPSRGRPSTHEDDAPGVPVRDSFGPADDPEMPLLAQALDPREARRQIERCLAGRAGEPVRLRLHEIRVVRHKPGRRCLVEYDVEVERASAPPEAITLVGKARAKGLDSATYTLAEALWNGGFDAGSEHGISVPEPLGVVPRFQMWLQRKVPGASATRLLAEAGGPALAGRIAEALHRLHRAGIPTHRRHTMADELRILDRRLPLVAQLQPRWAPRLERVRDACVRLGDTLPEPTPLGIHRDFYPDHVIVAAEAPPGGSGPTHGRLWLLDFDLYCAGDPALDAGNFIAHVTEQSLRTLGDPDALADQEQALEARFVALAGEATRPAVRAYATLTLVRHISLSTQLPGRRHLTGALLELCEQRLGAAASRASRAGAG